MISHSITMGIAGVFTAPEKWMLSWVYLTLPEVKHVESLAIFITAQKIQGSFLFSYIPASTLQIFQRSRCNPGTAHSREKAVVTTIYELSQRMPRKVSMFSNLCWITLYAVKARDQTKRLKRTPQLRTHSRHTHKKKGRGGWNIRERVCHTSRM